MQLRLAGDSSSVQVERLLGRGQVDPDRISTLAAVELRGKVHRRRRDDVLVVGVTELVFIIALSRLVK